MISDFIDFEFIGVELDEGSFPTHGFFWGNLFGAQSNPSEIHEKNTEGTKPELWIHLFLMIRLCQKNTWLAEIKYGILGYS